MPAESALRDRDGSGFQLIETLRWQRGDGYLSGDLHLARLRASAAALGFAWLHGAAERALEQAVADVDAGALRLRLTLDRDGAATCTAAAFAPLPPGTVWRLGIARTALDSSDTLLRHKTTRRAVYEAARAEFPPELADEVLLLNERGELCEGTITTLFLDMGDGGPLLTPALACGLLAGVLRGRLLSRGEARESMLTPSHLTAARDIFVGNSLRGLIAARTI